MIGRLVALALAGLLAAAPAMANQPKSIGTFKDWRAYTFEDAGGKICYAVSEPKKDEGKYTRRGDIYFLITHRPSGNVFNETNIITGYTYKKGYEPTATIGGKKFKFYSEGDAAWAFEADENKLIAAMKAGATMVVRGRSSRGTLTTDTYSLSGVTAAMNAIDKECKRQ